MKHSKKIVVSIAALMMTLSSKADNLPGRTRNLNILRHNKHLWFQLSSSEEGSHNILRDLACNCDNPDFELHILSSIRPFALLNKLGDFETDEELEEFLMNPKPSLVHVAYMQKLESEANRNMHAFTHDNLKEMLFSRDQDRKTVSDILEEKRSSRKAGCILVRKMVELAKQDIIQAEQKQQERHKIEELINQTAG